MVQREPMDDPAAAVVAGQAEALEVQLIHLGNPTPLDSRSPTTYYIDR